MLQHKHPSYVQTNNERTEPAISEHKTEAHNAALLKSNSSAKVPKYKTVAPRNNQQNGAIIAHNITSNGTGTLILLVINTPIK